MHLDEFPLYRVALDGITPKLEPMFSVEDVMSNIVIYEGLKEHIADDTPGYKHIPAGGSSGSILGWSADGTAEWMEMQAATPSDIDAILSGSYEEGTDPAEPSDPSDIATDEEIDNIVDNLF